MTEGAYLELLIEAFKDGLRRKHFVCWRYPLDNEPVFGISLLSPSSDRVNNYIRLLNDLLDEQGEWCDY